ncbi:MAG: hypothetical protein A3A33_03550 [Candidatus Yanofskybacteria bacterium RIFCSPLOWO2_01_FULL_49_25]|uniref:Uncharacterized protein n=1 Tax=Candidatus Yanofskybacteria bacterium RIFCSPLOWO2_01_FULL_49_25 TaxID=1802701 RepID=A0A1F8GVZ2_9BACT|nr:MAG: hypothetical protein A3A33_03550 [Candidatus Yanofskybacteria bacterium RIFCSPLOWO2_01_FULL_49_25]
MSQLELIPTQEPKTEVIEPDFGERKKERQIEVIAKNHEFAIAAYELESLISREDIQDKENAEIQEKLAVLPQPVRKRFEHALYNYFRQRDTMCKYEAEMEAIVEQQSNFGISRAEAREKLAKMMFSSLFGYYQAPLGKIKLEAREGYFLLTFENPKDYEAAVLAQRGKVVPGTDIEKSSGTYHHSVRLTMFEERYYGPVLMIRGDHKKEEIDNIIAHERQHFINHSVFALFGATEKYSDKRLHDPKEIERISGFQRIKDEVLAYLREGQTGSELKRSLHNELYIHLFKNLSPEDEKEARGILDKIAELLDHRSTTRASNEGRAIMVYQLAHVPFAEFPKWLQAIEEYYLDRFELLNKFDTDVSINEDPMVRNWYRMVTEGEYPPKYREYLASVIPKAEALVVQLKAIRKRARTIVFDQTLSPTEVGKKLQNVEAEYTNAKNQFSALYEPLKKNGILAISGGVPSSYEYGEEMGDGMNDESAYLTTVRDSLLEALDGYAQDEIDFISSYCDRSRT